MVGHDTPQSTPAWPAVRAIENCSLGDLNPCHRLSSFQRVAPFKTRKADMIGRATPSEPAGESRGRHRIKPTFSRHSRRQHYGMSWSFYTGFEVQFPVFCLRVAPFAEHHEVRQLVCILQVGIRGFPKSADWDDVMDFQACLSAVATTVLASPIALECLLACRRPRPRTVSYSSSARESRPSDRA